MDRKVGDCQCDAQDRSEAMHATHAGVPPLAAMRKKPGAGSMARKCDTVVSIVVNGVCMLPHCR